MHIYLSLFYSGYFVKSLLFTLAPRDGQRKREKSGGNDGFTNLQ